MAFILASIVAVLLVVLRVQAFRLAEARAERDAAAETAELYLLREAQRNRHRDRVQLLAGRA